MDYQTNRQFHDLPLQYLLLCCYLDQPKYKLQYHNLHSQHDYNLLRKHWNLDSCSDKTRLTILIKLLKISHQLYNLGKNHLQLHIHNKREVNLLDQLCFNTEQWNQQYRPQCKYKRLNWAFYKLESRVYRFL